MQQVFNSPDAWIYLLGAAGFVALLVLIFFKRRAAQKPRLKLPIAETEFKGLKTGTPTMPEATAAPLETVSLAAAPKASAWWIALSKTREKFFRISGENVAELRDSLEEACLISDLGVENTHDALNALDWNAINSAADPERLAIAKFKLAQVIKPWIERASSQENWLSELEAKHSGPKVVWFVGVNGVGKTTSIAKLAAELKGRGKTVLLAAGDTFRAAASEQLDIWAKRLEIDCVKGQDGADSSAVLFDAIDKAKAKKIDYVLCDSAGRLHNQNQLMEALKKNRRVIEKAIPSAPHEVLLVLDANTGQNMIKQAEQFIAAVSVSGLILTKLDGTARGGAVIAVARKTGLPIRRLGLGEQTGDFVAFDALKFSEALLGAER